MASNAGEKENDTPAVGESIPIGGKSESDKDGSGGSGVDDKGPGNDAGRPRRRQRIGARLSALRARIESGEASDEEKAEYQEQESRRKATRSEESPPPVKEAGVKRVKEAWRAKYGDTDDGRELVCKTVASYWSSGLCKLAEYIDDNGGEPFIDLLDREKRAEFNSLLVLASDDILPPGFKVTPAMIAAGGTSTLLIQAALIARKTSSAKEPQKAAVKSDEERVKEETERAKAVVDVPREPETASSPTDTPLTKKEVKVRPGARVDKEGNPLV